MLTIGIEIFVIGVILAGIATANFKARAFTNKPAWGGITLPFGITGFIALVVGLIMIVLTRS